MKYLPWAVCGVDPAIALDSKGCIAVDLRSFCSIGSGHDSSDIIEFIVSAANETHAKKEAETIRSNSNAGLNTIAVKALNRADCVLRTDSILKKG